VRPVSSLVPNLQLPSLPSLQLAILQPAQSPVLGTHVALGAFLRGACVPLQVVIVLIILIIIIFVCQVDIITLRQVLGRLTYQPLS